VAAKYDRIADDLRKKVSTGEWASGQQIPPETDLMRDYRVSLNTMRTALKVLRSEGLLEARHGTGTFVSAPRQRVRRVNDRYHWEKGRVHKSEDELRTKGATEVDTGLPVQDLTFSATYDQVKADERLAAMFNVLVGEPMLHRLYTAASASEQVPLSFNDSYIPLALIQANPDLLDQDREPWPGGTQRQLASVGIELDRIVDEVTARPPQGDEAERLGLHPGVSLIVVRKISVDTTDRVVEVSEIVMPGDRYELVYITPLERWQK
jgi:GntR family transcriptional regulator